MSIANKDELAFVKEILKLFRREKIEPRHHTRLLKELVKGFDFAYMKVKEKLETLNTDKNGFNQEILNVSGAVYINLKKLLISTDQIGLTENNIRLFGNHFGALIAVIEYGIISPNFDMSIKNTLYESIDNTLKMFKNIAQSSLNYIKNRVLNIYEENKDRISVEQQQFLIQITDLF